MANLQRNSEHYGRVLRSVHLFLEFPTLLKDGLGKSMEKKHRSKEDIDRDTLLSPIAENLDAIYLASVEEMMITGAGACPREKTIRQRAKFFRNFNFTTLEQLLSHM